MNHYNILINPYYKKNLKNYRTEFFKFLLKSDYRIHL